MSARFVQKPYCRVLTMNHGDTSSVTFYDTAGNVIKCNTISVVGVVSGSLSTGDDGFFQVIPGAEASGLYADTTIAPSAVETSGAAGYVCPFRTAANFSLATPVTILHIKNYLNADAIFYVNYGNIRTAAYPFTAADAAVEGR